MKDEAVAGASSRSTAGTTRMERLPWRSSLDLQEFSLQEFSLLIRDWLSLPVAERSELLLDIRIDTVSPSLVAHAPLFPDHPSVGLDLVERLRDAISRQYIG